MRLDELNTLTEDEAFVEFLRCCGSRRWARRMTEERPFGSDGAAAGAADRIWAALEPADWIEAFAAHPRIGGGGAARGNEGWSFEEQSAVARVGDALKRRLAEANRQYEARFGHVFIVSATGKSAHQMLAILGRRLQDDPSDELRIAAEEQRKITSIRLTKLLRTDKP